MVSHNKISEKEARDTHDVYGPLPIDRKRLDQFIDTININYKFNIKHAIDCELFENLNPHLKENLLFYITLREQFLFKTLFINQVKGYEMP